MTDLRALRDELAREIADEISAGEWCPSASLYRYRSVKRKLQDFEEQATANRGVRGESRSRPITATGGASAPVERVANPDDGAGASDCIAGEGGT